MRRNQITLLVSGNTVVMMIYLKQILRMKNNLITIANVILMLIVFSSCSNLSPNKENEDRDGCVITYYDNGMIKAIEHWKNDVRHGAYVFFDTNGLLSETGHYHSGILIGYIHKYHNGKLFESRQSVYLHSRLHTNQYINYSNGGSIEGSISNYFSINDVKGDTIRVNEKRKVSVELISPFFHEGMYVVLGNFLDENFVNDISTLESFDAVDFKSNIDVSFNKTGRNYLRGAIVNYSKEDTIIKNRIHFFEKTYMVVD